MKIYFDEGDDNYDNFDAENCDDYDHDVIYDDYYAEDWAAAADGDDDVDVHDVTNSILMISY